jgi:hypothetical protein
MILVDTSVLVDMLRGVETPQTKEFERIVLSDTPFAISSLTYQELLQGARNQSEYQSLKNYLATQKILYLPKNLDFYDKAAMCYRIIRSKGKTVRNTPDILIAMTAMHFDARLLHSDKDFIAIAEENNELDVAIGTMLKFAM